MQRCPPGALGRSGVLGHAQEPLGELLEQNLEARRRNSTDDIDAHSDCSSYFSERWLPNALLDNDSFCSRASAVALDPNAASFVPQHQRPPPQTHLPNTFKEYDAFYQQFVAPTLPPEQRRPPLSPAERVAPRRYGTIDEHRSFYHDFVLPAVEQVEQRCGRVEKRLDAAREVMDDIYAALSPSTRVAAASSAAGSEQPPPAVSARPPTPPMQAP